MSVITTADEKLKLAREHIDGAIQNLSSICIDRCHGWDEYKPLCRKDMHEALYCLIKMRDNLDWKNQV